VSSKPAREQAETISRRALVAGLFALAACGGEVPAPASARNGKRERGRYDAIELFPADLDLVVRVDLGRMRAQLGPTATGLAERLERETDQAEGLVSRALGVAKVAWIGVRLADIEAGDRVLVVEGDVEDLHPDPGLYRRIDPPIAEGVQSFEREGPLARDATARVHSFGGRTIAFVSPVEVDSVERILRNGPDERRRDPSAEGIVSADLRVRRLSPTLERRFKSIAPIIRGLDRARGQATMSGESFRVDLEIAAMSEASAKKAESVLRALREGGLGGRYGALFDDMSIERVEKAVRIRWQLAPTVLRALLEGTIAAPERVQGGP